MKHSTLPICSKLVPETGLRLKRASFYLIKIFKQTSCATIEGLSCWDSCSALTPKSHFSRTFVINWEDAFRFVWCFGDFFFGLTFPFVFHQGEAILHSEKTSRHHSEKFRTKVLLGKTWAVTLEQLRAPQIEAPSRKLCNSLSSVPLQFSVYRPPPLNFPWADFSTEFRVDVSVTTQHPVAKVAPEKEQAKVVLFTSARWHQKFIFDSLSNTPGNEFLMEEQWLLLLLEVEVFQRPHTGRLWKRTRQGETRTGRSFIFFFFVMF